MRNITKSGIIGLAILTAGLTGVETVNARGRGGRSSGGSNYGHTYSGSRPGAGSSYKQSRWDYQSSNKYKQKSKKQYKRADTDGSGKISSDEFRGSDKRFDHIDKNDDGEIGKWEFKNNKNQQKKYQYQNQYQLKNKNQYKRADSDGSGKISSDEFRGSDKRFDHIDKNDDGEIGKWEFKNNKNQQKKYQYQNQYQNQYQLKNKNQYKRADTDGSGKISSDEFSGSDKRFDRIDKNDDGEIGKWEFKNSKNQQKQYQNKYQQKTNSENRAQRFQGLDRDGSGSLSRDEFQGSDEAFGRLDRNGDGQVSPGEHRVGYLFNN